eukprot:TRINITY_DN8341_c0_g1_i1.p1 TRINITY_DN8341_c0_g1~~TRINITY_DN8341_c0_g1_i1.p1  ORF type:complete len:1074 (+),score=324.19 TRINITY_DN8341_c0_g1_i1:98-3319(+)
MEVEKAWTKKKGAGEQNKVRVCVRVRPFSAKELHGLEPNEYPLSIVDMTNSVVTVDEHPYPFEFDEAFWSIPEEQKQITSKKFAEQEDVFRSVGQPAVSHALHGFHSCIFAYGQTGSGKTHTMLGSEACPGVAPRLVEELFARLDEAGSKRGAFQHQVEISFMEIYNERVRDLFAETELSGAGGRRRTRRASDAIGLFRRESVGTGTRGRKRSETPPPLSVEKPVGLALPVLTLPEAPARRSSVDVRRASIESPKRRGSVGIDDAGSAGGDAASPASGGGPTVPFSWVEPGAPQSPKRVQIALPSAGEEAEASTRLDKPAVKRRASRTTLGVDDRRMSTASDRRMSGRWFGGVGGDEKEYKDLKVRFSRQQGTFVEGLQRLGAKEGVKTAEDVKRHMRFGMEHRSTAATQMNDTSSRSHAIFQICVKSTNQLAGVQRYAHINLVDLAGSERIKMSMAEGDRFVEATRINLSLSTLRRVIDLLIENSQKKAVKQVVPYRDSMLTWILSDSLGGNSKTTMMATVSPAASNREDTVNTLKYAHKAKDIVNTVFVNEQKTSVAMNAMQREIQDLRRALEEANSGEESANVAELQDQLQAVESDYQTAIEDLERAEGMRKQHEEAIREGEEMVKQRELEVDHLRQQGVEEKHQDAATAVEETTADLESKQRILESKAREMEFKEQQVEAEKDRVAQILTAHAEVQDRELAFRKEMLVVRRKQFALAFHKAFKETKSVSTRERVEMELRQTTDRVAKDSLEIQARAEQCRDLQRLCEGLLSTTAKLESAAVKAEKMCADGEQTSQDTMRQLRAAKTEAEAEISSLRTELKAVDSEAMLVRERGSRDRHVAQERRRLAQSRVDSVCNEADKKRTLVEQLGKQLHVLTDEIQRLRDESQGMRNTQTSMEEDRGRIGAECEAMRASIDSANVEYKRIQELLPERQSELGALSVRVAERRERVQQHRRTHDELKTYASQRFFPAAARPDEDGAVPDTHRSSHVVERTWTSGGYLYTPHVAMTSQQLSPRECSSGRASPTRISRSRLSAEQTPPSARRSRASQSDYPRPAACQPPSVAQMQGAG